MLYYTIIPGEWLFAETSTAGARSLLEVRRGGVTMLVVPTAHGTGRVERLVSTEPLHFLDPSYQPGAEIVFQREEVVREWQWSEDGWESEA